MRQRDALALAAVSIAVWFFILQGWSFNTWTLALFVGGLAVYAYPRVREMTGGAGPTRPNVVSGPSDRADTAAGIVLSGVVGLVIVGFLFIVYVGFAECIPFGLGGASSC